MQSELQSSSWVRTTLINIMYPQDCDVVVASKFFPIDGSDGKQQPLCERDYFRRLNLICVKCGQALRGSYITACSTSFPSRTHLPVTQRTPLLKKTRNTTSSILRVQFARRSSDLRTLTTNTTAMFTAISITLHALRPNALDATVLFSSSL